jgi:hypothetical protein
VSISSFVIVLRFGRRGWGFTSQAGRISVAVETAAGQIICRVSDDGSPTAAARRRAFKEAMRRRIRDVAASRDLSDEKITAALTLKHQEIARFSEQHGVNIEWLLEGKGRVYRGGRCELMDILDGDEPTPAA